VRPDRATRETRIRPRPAAARRHGSLRMTTLTALSMHRRCMHWRRPGRLGRLDARPDLLWRTFWPGRTSLTVMVGLLGIGGKGKCQRNQWKDEPRSAESVHSCKPLFGHCGETKRLGLYSSPVFASSDGAGNIADRPVTVCPVTNP
jgi:hypothetical protein